MQQYQGDESLSDSEYYDTQFGDLKLDSLEISNKVFENCRFCKVSLSESKLSNCRFVDCEFDQCNLSTAEFKNSSFSEVIFENCKMIGINWTKLKWPLVNLASPLKFYRCNLSHSSFYELALTELVMEECKANEVDLRGGDFSEASFILTDFAGSQFMHTKLRGADFSEAFNYVIDPVENTITKAKFTMPDAMNLLVSFDIEVDGLTQGE